MLANRYFYTCKLKSLVCCALDCDAWVQVLEDALRDESGQDWAGVVYSRSTTAIWSLMFSNVNRTASTP